ncbi:MAG: ATP-grasp domain-containing protein [Phycisphaerae bacterium]
MNIGLVTCRILPEPDPDKDLLLESLRTRDLSTEWVAWDDADVDWSAFDHIILRSTWNYPQAFDKFQTWLKQVQNQTSLWNPYELIRWNLHKSYLPELFDKGVSTIPTVCLPAGQEQSMERIVSEKGWGAVVVKPAVSAGSWLTRKFDHATDGQMFLSEMLSERDVLIQPYMPAAAQGLEAAIIAIDGEFTHVVQKSSRFAGDDESVSQARPLTDREREFATNIMAQVPQQTLYARVDVIPDESGELLLAELELVEPSLFLKQHPPALERLADAIKRLNNRA